MVNGQNVFASVFLALILLIGLVVVLGEIPARVEDSEDPS